MAVYAVGWEWLQISPAPWLSEATVRAHDQMLVSGTHANIIIVLRSKVFNIANSFHSCFYVSLCHVYSQPRSIHIIVNSPRL